MDVEMRASDEDRQRTIIALERHTTAGRLTIDEFSDRVADVYAARTLADLATVTRDLPVEPSGSRIPDSSSRHLVIAFVIAVAALVLLGLVLSLR